MTTTGRHPPEKLPQPADAATNVKRRGRGARSGYESRHTATALAISAFLRKGPIGLTRDRAPAIA